MDPAQTPQTQSQQQQQQPQTAPTQPTQKPSVGRLVQYGEPFNLDVQWLPLLVTHVHSETCVSGILFNAFSPDAPATPRTSILLGTGVGTWRWPPRV